jgi:hypothetical protein
LSRFVSSASRQPLIFFRKRGSGRRDHRAEWGVSQILAPSFSAGEDSQTSRVKSRTMTSNKKPKPPLGSWILIGAGAIELIVSFVLPAPRFEAWHNFLMSMGGTMLIIGLVWLIFSQRGSSNRRD